MRETNNVAQISFDADRTTKAQINVPVILPSMKLIEDLAVVI